MNRSTSLTFVFILFLTLFIFAIDAYAQNIDIPDVNLRTALEEALDKTAGEQITRTDLETLVNLTAENREIRNLTGLAFASRLQVLNLRNNVIDDISDLAELTQLNNLQLGANAITDISPLAGKIALETLVIDNNSISNLTPLSGLINLVNLNISNNVIRDLSPLSDLNRLVNITMSGNPPADLSPLKDLLSLRNFSSSGTPILDLTPFASIPKLRRIDIRDGEISDLSPLEGLSGLRELYLVDNDIEDIKPLATLTGLTHLNLRQNEITDVTALATLPSLVLLDLQDNEILDFTPLNELERRGVSIIRNNNPGFSTDPPKIVGPWLWVIVPTDGRSGKEAAESGIDFLDQVSNGTVTEQMVATQGAVQGVSVGKKVWKIGFLSRRGGNNINELVNKIGLGIDDINHHVAYGSIVLDSLQAQQSRLHVGSGDAVKVWLNGTLIHENAVDRNAEDYQDEPIPISLKKGENILLVAVYEGKGWWSGFFGLDPATEYEARIPNYRAPVPHRADVNGDGRVSILDMIEVSRYFGSLKVDGSSANTNDDDVIDIRDLIFVAQHLGTQTNSEESAPLSPAMVENWIALAWDKYDGSIAFQEGITYLENLLILLTSEKLFENTIEKTALFANYPNPLNPETWIPYQLAAPSKVYVTIHSSMGKVVKTLTLGHQPVGVYKTRNRAAYWDGKNEIGEPVASGIYFYTLKAGDFTATRKMLIRK